MKVIGISPLDRDSTVTLVEDGQVVYAAAEERFTRVKLQDGFPWQALQDCLVRTGTDPADVAAVAYPLLSREEEAALITDRLEDAKAALEGENAARTTERLRQAEGRVPARTTPIPGLAHPNEKIEKGFARRGSDRSREARHFDATWHEELENALGDVGLGGRLRRHEHHRAHAANAYYGSGFDEALIVSLDGCGSGLAGAASLGRGGRIERLHGIACAHSLGAFYESVTSGLGFRPGRHEGQILGLAAYGDPAVLRDVLRARIDQRPGSFRIRERDSMEFARLLASQFPKVDVAAAYQDVLETVVTDYVRFYLRQTGANHVVLSGGVVANVKLNQRIFEIEGVEGLFVYPNMGDGGTGTGAALLEFEGRPELMTSLPDVYLGPSYTDDDILAALQRSQLAFDKYAPIEPKIAQLIAAGKVVARFNGRMEYGPRSLGNRSIFYHAREPEVNQWLNQRLGRTEFMPFAPATLHEHRHRCYRHVDGADVAAQFMTVTFDCTEFMRDEAPAAVHVDGTARPQLVTAVSNPSLHHVLTEYHRLTGLPSIINTSFNMHEEPIVCGPDEAVRAFLQGNLDYLAIGPFLVAHPSSR